MAVMMGDGFSLPILLWLLFFHGHDAEECGKITIKQPAILGRTLQLTFKPARNRDVSSADDVTWKRNYGIFWPTINQSPRITMGYDSTAKIYTLTIKKTTEDDSNYYYVQYANSCSSKAIWVKLEVLKGCGLLTLDTPSPKEGQDVRLKLIPRPDLDPLEKSNRRWEVHGTPIEFVSQSRYRERYDAEQDVFVLTVLGTTRVDSGEYRVVCGQRLEQTSNTVKLNIFFPPKSVSLNGPDVPRTVEPTYRLPLTCHINQSNPACLPEWYPKDIPSRKYAPVSSTSGGDIFNAEQTIDFHVTNHHNRRTIYCTASCERFPDLHLNDSYTIRLPYQPVVIIEPSVYTEVYRTGSVSIRCIVDSAPEAEVYWVRAETRLVNKTRQCGPDTCLTLKNVGTEDSGNYTCIADNGVYPEIRVTIEIHVNDTSFPSKAEHLSDTTRPLPIVIAVSCGFIAFIVIVIIVVLKFKLKGPHSNGFKPPEIQMQEVHRASSTSNQLDDPVYSNVTKDRSRDIMPVYAAVVPKSQRSTIRESSSRTPTDTADDQGLVYVELDLGNTGQSNRQDTVRRHQEPEEVTEYSSIDILKTKNYKEEPIYTND